MQNYVVRIAGDEKGLFYENYEVTYQSPGIPDILAPSFANPPALNANRSQIILSYNEPLSGNPVAANYTVTGVTITAASIVGSIVALTLNPIPVSGVAITVAYVGTTVKDASGNAAPTFAATTIPNP